MKFWTEIHWSEGMFLRPHHLQAGQRWIETILCSGLDSVQPFGRGMLELEIAPEPLENFTLQISKCTARMPDGSWINVPDNTRLAPLNFQDALEESGGRLEVFLGIPLLNNVRPNAVSLQEPDAVNGVLRYEPHAVTLRDENTGQNPQTTYVRHMLGRLFTASEDMTGYTTIRVGTLKRTDRPGAVPEIEELSAGPLLAIQADEGLSRLFRSLTDQIEAKDEKVAQEVREHSMQFTDGVAANMELLLKLHALNQARAEFKALMQSPLLHPFSVFNVLCRLVGQLAIFSYEELVPGTLPQYDHDRPGESLGPLRAHIVTLLDALQPMNYRALPFARKADERGVEVLEVELERRWIDDNLDLYVALDSEEPVDGRELINDIYSRLNLKLASPLRAPRIINAVVAGLRLESRPPPAGMLPRRQGRHYFKINKAIGQDRTDYWRECEQERAIRVAMQEAQLPKFERYHPTLYVILKGRS